MSKFRALIHRWPVVLILVVAFIQHGVNQLLTPIYRLVPNTPFMEMLFEFICILWPIGLVLLLGYGFIFREKGFGKTLKTGLFFFLLYLIMLVCKIFEVSATSPQWQPISGFLLGVLMLIGVGVREEVLFRGIITNFLALRYTRSTRSLWSVLLLSGGIFGLAHATNIFMGMNPLSALLQIVSATGIGVAMAAIYLRGGSIYFMILLHAIIDAFALFESTFLVSNMTGLDQMNSITSLAPLLVLPIGLLITAFLVRKSKREAVFTRLEALRSKQAA